MNKYGKDLEIAINEFEKWRDSGFSKSEAPNSYSLILAISAFKKTKIYEDIMTPKKPMDIIVIDSIKTGVCSNCGANSVDELDHYCSWCGHEIDWSKDNE